MTNLEATLRAILDFPEDDLPRLQYADLLEEHGQPERAEFVRVQVALAKHEAVVALRGDGFPPPPMPEGFLLFSKRDALRRRELELLAMPLAAWREHCRPLVHDGSGPGWSWGCRRGFVEHIGCAAADWLAHADALLAAQPVREVTLTTLADCERIHGQASPCRRFEQDTPAWPWCDACRLLDSEESRGRWWPRVRFTLPGATVGATTPEEEVEHPGNAWEIMLPGD